MSVHEIAEVAEKLFKEAGHVYKEHGKLTDEVLTALHCVFQSTLLSAMELVDKKSVTVVTCPSGRSVYQVMGSSGKPYTCFPSSNYCSCPAFKFSVLLKEDHLMCKHMLAVHITEACGLSKQLQVSDREVVAMIQQID